MWKLPDGRHSRVKSGPLYRLGIDSKTVLRCNPFVSLELTPCAVLRTAYGEVGDTIDLMADVVEDGGVAQESNKICDNGSINAVRVVT